jgi:hypothetical protein
MSHSYALDGYFDDLIQVAPRPQIDWRIVATLACVVALCAVVVLGTPRVVETYRGYQAAQLEAAAALNARAPVELPREWRWQPRGVEFDQMYRSAR